MYFLGLTSGEFILRECHLGVGGELIEPLKNHEISKFFNRSQTLDLRSSNSCLNGTYFGFLKFLPIWTYFGLKSRLFDNYRSPRYFY